MWKLNTSSHLSIFDVRSDWLVAAAGLFCKIATKYLAGFCFSTCLLAGAPKICSGGQMFALSPPVPACAQVLADAVFPAREELFAGCEISAWIKCQKASPWFMGRAHLTFDSLELRSPLGGSVGSAPEQSSGCHEHDLPTPAVTDWAGVRFVLR